jgi:hypothetical protein
MSNTITPVKVGIHHVPQSGDVWVVTDVKKEADGRLTLSRSMLTFKDGLFMGITATEGPADEPTRR